MLAEGAAPPIKRVEFGPPEDPIVLGEETVLYRHERRFEHAPALALLVKDDADEETFGQILARFQDLTFERVGEQLRPRLLAFQSDDAEFLARRVRAALEAGVRGLMLISDLPEVLRTAGAAAREVRPLLCGARKDTFAAVAEIAADLGTAFVAQGRTWEELQELGQAAISKNISNMLFEPIVSAAGDALAAQVFLRRAAVRDKVKSLGFPAVAFPCRLAPESLLQTVIAAALVAKYAGVVVMDTFDPACVLSVLTLAQGLYTDPQKPMMVEPGIYPVDNPGPESPVLLTTNFSLTYYTVTGEVENSKIPAWLLVMDAEGQSVLTA
ncbi:MAG: acetyl-CoA decarbonylase/synthase complex subunit gamma, partial [Thermoleophilia bacterium]|nr:acetyl-CoA decarbonylase/synthase complex subunit gamma [Thermoleophilia bacterium]